MLSTFILLTSLILWPLLVFFPNMQARLFRRGPRNLRPRNAHDEASSSSSSSSSGSPSANDNSSSAEPQPYEPSALDVVVAKLMLQQGLRLPPEVVLSILDFAEYWPHTTAVLNRRVDATAGNPSENSFVVCSSLDHPRPLPPPSLTLVLLMITTTIAAVQTSRPHQKGPLRRQPVHTHTRPPASPIVRRGL